MALHVLRPLAQDYERRASTNTMSSVVRMQEGSIPVLLTGDLPADGEDALVGREPVLRTQLLMAPHHGRRSWSSPALRAAVAPLRVFAESG